MQDLIRVSLRSCLGIVTRQVDRRGRMTITLELLPKLLPAPRTVVSAVNEREMHSGKDRRQATAADDPCVYRALATTCRPTLGEMQASP